MSTFTHPIAIAATVGGPFRELQAVVDTGAFYSWVPSSVLDGLGVEPTGQDQFVLADGSTIERDTTEIVVRIDGRTRHTICVFGDEGTEPLLGAYTLEGFALMVDPMNQRLVPIPRLYMLAVERRLS